MALSKVQEIFKDWEIKVEEIPSLQAAISSLLKKYPNGSEELREAKKILEKALWEEWVIVNQKTRSDIQWLAKDINSRLNEENEVIEWPVEYSMEWVGQLNKSKVFDLFLDRPQMLFAYKTYVIDSIKDYPYIQQEELHTIEITLWQHIVSKLSFWGVSWLIWDKIFSFFSDKKDAIQNAFSQGVENDEWSEDDPVWIDKLTTLSEAFSKVREALDAGDEESAKTGFKNNIKTMLDDITKPYFLKLKEFDTLAKEYWFIGESGEVLKPEIQDIFKNPIIISELTKNGVYKQDGTHIDIEASVIEISAQSDSQLSDAQSSFMKELWGEMNENGSTIDWLQKQSGKIAKLLNSFGFSNEDITWFIDRLESDGGIWAFIATILKFFINGVVLSELDKIDAEQIIETSLSKLKGFVNNKEKQELLPFTLEDTGINKEQWETMSKFLSRIRIFEGERLEKWSPNTTSVINNEEFWNIFFSKKPWESDNQVINSILGSIVPLKEKSGKISQEDFFKKLKEIQITEYTASSGDKDSKEEGTKDDDSSASSSQTSEAEKAPDKEDGDSGSGDRSSKDWNGETKTPARSNETGKKVTPSVAPTTAVTATAASSLAGSSSNSENTPPGNPSPQAPADDNGSTDIPQMSQRVTYKEQILWIQSLPATISKDARLINVAWNSNWKTLDIWWVPYGVSSLIGGWQDLLKSGFSIEDLSFSWGKWELTLWVNLKWQALIKYANSTEEKPEDMIKVENNTVKSDISLTDVHAIILGIIENGAYTHIIPSDPKDPSKGSFAEVAFSPV